ncbi:hypothetical protein M9H77_26334 [Catharanthus roseus]|uniref:Uncharacterized protein n=1 Tax=Catharanthus roseus TaxID=4058 RepID=A0ACC0ADF5_CATRO|nr:hypothetical protein M9H77_26334 [Catharanthus roseus]
MPMLAMVKQVEVVEVNTFKRMEFEITDEGLFTRGGQQGSDDDEEKDNGDEEERNDPESMDDEEEDIRREMRSKKRQERTEEGQSSVDTATLLEAKDLGDQGKMKEKRSSH